MSLTTLAVRRCVARGLLAPAVAHADVYWTPSVAARLSAANGRHQPFAALRYPDVIVGTYATLKSLRETIRAGHAGLWIGTDIHHITENQHLGFVARAGVVGDASYEREEPCVLLPQDHHRLLMDSLIGVAETLEREARREDETLGVDYIAEYKAWRAKHPIPHAGARPNRTDKARHRARWVALQPPGTRQKIADMLVQVYAFAYQQSEERPLDLIATDTLRLLAR